MTPRHPKQPDKSTTALQPLVSKPQPAQLQALLQPAALVQRAAQSPAALTHAEVLQLHRTLGNRAVGQLVQGSLSRQIFAPTASHARMTVQPKLVVDPVGDHYEEEADRVAQQVVQQLDAEPLSPAGQAVQRQAEDAKAPLQLQPAAIQPQPGERGMTVSPDLEAAIQQARGRGQPLPETLRGRLEQVFQADFGRVRIHADADSDVLNRSMQARAFTTGNDVFFRQGTYRPASRSGQAVLAHELSHVVQQGETAISPDGALASHATAAVGRVQRMIGPHGNDQIVIEVSTGDCYRATEVSSSQPGGLISYLLTPIEKTEAPTSTASSSSKTSLSKTVEANNDDYQLVGPAPTQTPTAVERFQKNAKQTIHKAGKGIKKLKNKGKHLIENVQESISKAPGKATEKFQEVRKGISEAPGKATEKFQEVRGG